MSTKRIKAKNYLPKSISFGMGFLGADILGGANKKPYFMKVDAAKARRIVLKQLAQGRKIDEANLGLDGDWSSNHTTIYSKDANPKFADYDAYEGSIWATPTLIISYESEPSEAYECWKKRTE